MLRYLRMDLYRLVKGKMLWVVLGIVLAVSVASAYMAWLTVNPEFAPSGTNSSSGFVIGATDGSAESAGYEMLSGAQIADFSRNQTAMWLSGGALALFVSVMPALLFAADFSSGYVKNLPTSRKDRLAYYGEKLVLVVLLVALLLVFGIATFEVSRIVSGLSYAHVGSAADIALWFGLSVLIVSMYGAAIAVVTWLTQSKAAGLAAAIAVGSTLLGGLVVTVLQGLAMLWEPFNRAMEWLPFYSYKLLLENAGTLSSAPDAVSHIVAVCGAVLVACVAVALGVCARKDV